VERDYAWPCAPFRVVAAARMCWEVSARGCSLGAAGDGGVVCSQRCQPKQCINSWVDHSSCDHLVLKGLDDLVADHAANFVLLYASGVCVCLLPEQLATQ
jgi:hypothetical protein